MVNDLTEIPKINVLLKVIKFSTYSEFNKKLMSSEKPAKASFY